MYQYEMHPKRTSSKKPLKYISAGVAAMLVLVLVFNSIGSVPKNHVGILIRAGVVQDTELPEGWKLKIPFVDYIESMSNEVQTLRIASGVENPTTSETAETKDRQLIPAFEFEIQYQLSKDRSFDVYKNYGKNYERFLVESNAVSAIKQVFSHYGSEDIVTNKEKIPNEICEALNQVTEPNGIHIHRVNMKTYDFTPEYTAILEERAMLSAQLKNNEIKQNNERIAAQTAQDVAVKNAETAAETARIKAENDKEVALIQANMKAETDKINAENEYYVTTKKAQADKEARLARAEAMKAELEAQAAGLDEQVLMKLFIEKWDGKLIPNFGGGSSFEFTDMTEIISSYLGVEAHGE